MKEVLAWLFGASNRARAFTGTSEIDLHQALKELLGWTGQNRSVVDFLGCGSITPRVKWLHDPSSSFGLGSACNLYE
jgi:hypothetical protein